MSVTSFSLPNQPAQLVHRRDCRWLRVRRSNIGNVARCWVRETAIAIGEDLGPGNLPRGSASSSCYDYLAPDHNLEITPALMKDMNTPGYLQSVKDKICAELDSNAAFADPSSEALESETGAKGRKRSATAAGLSVSNA